jgi:hypothetical protein
MSSIRSALLVRLKQTAAFADGIDESRLICIIRDRRRVGSPHLVVEQTEQLLPLFRGKFS